jgi:hypothetical protein
MSAFTDVLCFGLTEAKDIVHTLKSNTIEKIVRAYNPYALEMSIKDSKSVLNTSAIFNVLIGELLFYLSNGDVIGFHAEDMKHSIVAWYEVHQGKQEEECYFLRDLCSYMRHDDPVYSHKDNLAHIIGNPITSIKVVVYEKMNEVVRFNDSSQRGIIIETAKGHMVMSYGLDELPVLAPFTLCQKSDIPQEIWDKATIIEV